MSAEELTERTILFVDDEQQVLNSLKRELRKEPYQKLFANSPLEAIELLKKEKIHVIVSDMRMPQMTGLELLKFVKKEYPEIIRIVLSGYTQFSTILSAINSGDIFRYITKPWKFEEDFLPTIRQAILLYNENEKTKQKMSDLENRIKKLEHRELSLISQLRDTSIISTNLINFVEGLRSYLENTFSFQNISAKNELRTLHKFSNLLNKAKSDIFQDDVDVNSIGEMLYYKLKSNPEDNVEIEINQQKKISIISSKFILYFMLEDLLKRLILSNELSKIQLEIGSEELNSEIAIIFFQKRINIESEVFLENIGLHYFNFMANLIKVNIEKRFARGRGIILFKF